MTEQYELFGGLPPHVQTDTSFDAAVEIAPHTSTLRRKVLAFIRERGAEGATDEEVQEALGMAANTQRPRRVELVLMDQVVDTGRRRKTRSGRSAIVWEAL